MKNLFLLPTDNLTRLFTTNSEITLAGYPATTFKTGKHIYITNSEEIKEGQNYIGDGFSGKNKFKWHKSQVELYPNIKKDIIILTTDQDLIKDGVQAIDDEFLEWFVKNPSCEEVEIRKIEDELISPKNPKIRFNALKDPPSFISAESLNNMILTYKYEIIISKQSTKDRIMSETSEETKQKARDYGNILTQSSE